VDGSLVPAWAQQRPAYANGKWDPKLEAHLRRRAPEAGYVAYSRFEEDGLDEKAHADQRADRSRKRSYHASVRGYRLTTLVDVATGLPLVFDLRDATKAHEPRVLRDILLPTLFGISPDLSVDTIVGDAAYDDNATHEHLETRYGIHVVVGRKAHAFTRRGVFFSEDEHRSVKGVQGTGVPVCRAHRRQLQLVEIDMPSRSGLRPGEPTNPASFRLRFFCPDGCGKVSVQNRLCWSNLPYYPYTPHGWLKLYAHRRAMLHRRNQVEAAFSSLQVGYKQCLDGAARVRVFDRTVNEALLAISIATRALLALHAERSRHSAL
jgi:hypothetical protein